MGIFTQDHASNACCCEHGLDEGFKLDVAMAQLDRNWTLKLELVRLEANDVSMSFSKHGIEPKDVLVSLGLLSVALLVFIWLFPICDAAEQG